MSMGPKQDLRINFKKKIQPKFKQSGKTLPNHNSVLAEHISNLGPEKKLGQDTR